MMGFALAWIALVCRPHQIAYDEQRLIRLAKQSVIAEVNHQPMPISQDSTPAVPVFVTIEVNGKVRGCRGDLNPRTQSLDSEVIREAQAASQHDPRYSPIRTAELKDFKVTVTIVERLEPLGDLGSLRPEDGLVLSQGDHFGIVLPWEGRDPKTRLNWAYRKAALPEGVGAKLERLIAKRFRG
jgi:AMMECR1 domain-containing protein